jgi:UDP-N-acetylglucosamine acyltransferase
VSINISQALDRLCYRFPSALVDTILEHEPGRRLVAAKNITVSEEFFQGHFPGAPLLPAVLMVESLSQVAAILVRDHEATPQTRVYLRGVNSAKFRRQVVPGDRLHLEIVIQRRRGGIVFALATAHVGDQLATECQLVLGVVQDPTAIHPSANVHPSARIGAGCVIGPQACIGPNVVLGPGCKVGASAVVDGWTEIGEGTEIFPFASIGLAPQDLKYHGEPTRLVIGARNVFREFVTIHRGTDGGGGVTRIGDDNLFMAYVHVAHDCHVGNRTIFGNTATLGGHVHVEDFANVSAGSAVHQFCRVGKYAFIGGYSVVTKDALPYARTVGNRARIYGLNTIGLMRRGFTSESVMRLKRAFRYLLQSKLNTSAALQRIEADQTLAGDEVRYLIDFIRGSERGVILKRASRRTEDLSSDD